MGVSGEQHIKICRCRLAIDLRRVRQQDRKRGRRDLCRRFLDVLRSKEVRIINAGQMDKLIPAGESLAFIEQHSDAEPFEPRHHADRIVVAEDTVDRALKMRPDQSLNRRTPLAAWCPMASPVANARSPIC